MDASARADALRAPWPLALVVALALLTALDAVFRVMWHPHPNRLPEQFSPAYLDAYIDGARGTRPIVVLGDSVLWGYDVPADDAVVARLARMLPGSHVLNLSYEGGSIVNSVFALRLALARGVEPAAVLVNLNSKEFNPADSAYRRLLPALERDVAPLLQPRDRARLSTLPPAALPGRLDAAVGRVWAFYGQRVDVRVALFGYDDAAGLLTARVHALTGEERRYARLHRPTADAFLGTYDLEPPARDNVEMAYLRELRDELARRRIPTVAFLTPTNHRLLADSIDDPAYDANLRRIAAGMRAPAIRVVDLDRFDAGGHFIDNDHLDATGSAALAARLAQELANAR